MNFLTLIPAQVRLYLYLGYTLIGVFFGAVQVGFASLPDTSQPSWLTVALVIYAYLGTALGLTAASNVTRQDGPPPAPQNNPLRDDA